MRIYNTLTGQKEDFVPLQSGAVRMYACGPTVYQNVHIGNFRTFIFQDVLRRFFLYRNYRVTHVMNITDVDDKTIENARQQGVSLHDYTRRYAGLFFEDMKALRIQKPEFVPYATDHIDDMIALVEKLAEKNLTYTSEGSVYFRIDRFESYGRLARIQPGQLKTGVRVDSQEYDKENPRDFVLWRASRDGEPSWPAPFGEGRPGWHLECSAMGMKYLGETFDIHCGGVDLIFPHHENEIAQSEGATGRPFVKYWVHCEHLFVEGEKMSKSRGNFYTLRDLLERNYSAQALRYLLLSAAHYRKQLNFTFDSLQQAQSALERVSSFLVRARSAAREGAGAGIAPHVERARSDFDAALEDDLNVPNAVAAIFELIRELNTILDRSFISPSELEQIESFFQGCNSVLDVFDLDAASDLDQEIRQLIELRNAARQRRDFKESDRIRDLLLAKGIVIEDTRDGVRWKRK